MTFEHRRRELLRISARRRPERAHRVAASGQSLVEFVLVFPIFFVILLAIVEFGFTMNAWVSVDFATRDAALAAAEAGNDDHADCSILRAIDTGMTAPARNKSVLEVRVFKADVNGKPLGPVNVYDRNGTTSCPLADGTPANVGYHLVSMTYDQSTRCNELQGCNVQATVDTIGVQISYGYSWVTPLHLLMPTIGPGYTMVKSNAMRMEPVL